MGAGASVDAEEQAFIDEKKKETQRIENALMNNGVLHGTTDEQTPFSGPVATAADSVETKNSGFDDNLLFLDPTMDLGEIETTEALRDIEERQPLDGPEIEVIDKWTVSFPAQFSFFRGVEYSSDCRGAWLADAGVRVGSSANHSTAMSEYYHRRVLEQLNVAGCRAVTGGMREHYLQQLQLTAQARQTENSSSGFSTNDNVVSTMATTAHTKASPHINITDNDNGNDGAGLPVAVAMIPGHSRQSLFCFRVAPNTGSTPSATALSGGGVLRLSFGLFRSYFDATCSKYSYPTETLGRDPGGNSWGVACTGKYELCSTVSDGRTAAGTGSGETRVGASIAASSETVLLLRLSLEFWHGNHRIHQQQLYATPDTMVTLVYSTNNLLSTASGSEDSSMNVGSGGSCCGRGSNSSGVIASTNSTLSASLDVFVNHKLEYQFVNIPHGRDEAAGGEVDYVDVFATSVSNQYRVYIEPELAGVIGARVNRTTGSSTVVPVEDDDAGMYHTRFDMANSTGSLGPLPSAPSIALASTVAHAPSSTASGTMLSLVNNPPLPAASAAVNAVESEQQISNQCIICMDGPKCVVLMPCKHFCVCEACAGLIQQCPVCRKKIIHTLTIFNT